MPAHAQCDLTNLVASVGGRRWIVDSGNFDYQAGSMRELNPLGSGLIADATQLITFKVAVTSLAIALLYWLHQSPLAQRASWWCCLILTLLTARWLTFQSMFM